MFKSLTHEISMISAHIFDYIYCKNSIVLALTSSHSSSSPGVESNQGNVTCFDLFRSHQTRLLVRRQEVRENSQICSHWMDSRVTSNQQTVRLWRRSFQKSFESFKNFIKNRLQYKLTCKKFVFSSSSFSFMQMSSASFFSMISLRKSSIFFFFAW